MVMDRDAVETDETNDMDAFDRTELDRQRSAYAAFQKRLLAEQRANAVDEAGEAAAGSGDTASDAAAARADSGRCSDLLRALKAQEREHPAPDDLRRREATAEALNAWRRHHQGEDAPVEADFERFERLYGDMTQGEPDAADLARLEALTATEEKAERRAKRKQDERDWYWFYYFQ